MATTIVTGGAGFIGSAVVRKLIRETDDLVINIDKLTYAGNLSSLEEIWDDPRHVFKELDICDGDSIKSVFETYCPQRILHLAAESHVDRSIDGPSEFIQSNVVGTYTLLEVSRDYWMSLDTAAGGEFRFQHVSTDEVYGSLGKSGYFTEESCYKPNSPYSASKAASDHLVRAWCSTYGLPTIVSNCSNNYGPYQNPEKLVPLMINKALKDENLPVYGKGENVRDWLYVDDHAEALMKILKYGRVGETYNVGGRCELSNIDLVRILCDFLDELAPRTDGCSHRKRISFVEDRPGHDLRYAIDSDKIEGELKWRPRETLESGLRKTVEWYLSNQEWCRQAMKKYRGERLGVLDKA